MCGGYCQPQGWFAMDATRCTRWMGILHTGMLPVRLSVRRSLTSATMEMKMYLQWIKAKAKHLINSLILSFYCKFCLKYLNVLVAYTSYSLMLSENLITPP